MGFDRQSFDTLIEGDKDLFSSLLSLFEEEWPHLIEKIQQGIQEGRAKAVEESSHRLKGCLRNFYASSCSQLVEQLEVAGRTNQLNDLEQTIDHLIHEIQVLQTELRQYFDEIP